MILVYITLLVFYLFLSNYNKNNKKTICSLYILIWIVIGGISTLGLLGIDKPSLKMHIIIISSLFIFFIGSTIGTKLRIHSRNHNDAYKFRFLDTKTYKKGFLFTVQLIAWIICFLYLPRAISLFIKVGYSDLRYYAYNSSNLYMSTSELLFFQCFIQPLFFAANIIYLIQIIENKKKALIFPLILNTVLYAFMFGGREIVILDILVITFLVYMNNRKSIINIINNNKRVILIIFLISGILIYLISLRKYNDRSAIDTIITYLVGPITFMDKLISSKQYPSSLLLGRALIGSIFSIIDYIILIFVNRNWITTLQIINGFTQSYQSIGQIRFNALATYFYPSICDFGYFGIVIYPFCIGIFSAIVEREYKEKNSMISTAMFYYISYIIAMSTMNYYMMSAVSGIIMISFIVFCDKAPVKKGG